MRAHQLVILTASVAALLVVSACSSDETTAATPDASSSGGSSSGTSGASGDAATSGDAGTSGDASTGPFAITSSAYAEGAAIPKKYECVSGGGESKSPPLAWSGAPAGTMSYAIVMRDLNFTPNGAPFIHWAIWDIPSTLAALPEGVAQTANPANVSGATQAPFNAQVIGYFGPCSPNSVNTYEMTLYAIPTAQLAGITSASTKVEAAAAIVSAASGSAKLAGKS